MIVWAVALLGVLATWALLLLIGTGLGLLLLRPAGPRTLDSDDILVAAWIGAAVSIALLQLWNFVWPIRWPAGALLAVAGSVGLFIGRRDLRRWLVRFDLRRHGLPLVVILVAVAWAGDRAMGPLEMYDGGSYHMPVMAWARAYPVVPGLANLHGRLAFNNSSLLLAALLDAGPWAGRAYHLVNGFFLALLLGQVLLHATRLPHVRGGRRGRYAFDLALLAPLLAMLMDDEFVSSYSPDVPAGLALLVALSLLVRPLLDADSRTNARVRRDVGAATVLLAMAVTIKLTVGLAAVLAWAVAFGWIARSGTGARRRIGAAVLASTLLVLPWLARGVVLSGYPLYPSTVMAAPVDWRADIEQARAEMAWVGYFARTEEDTMAVAYVDQLPFQLQWVKSWSYSFAKDWRWRMLLLLPACLCMFLLTPLLIVLRRRGPPVPRTLAWLLLPTAGGAIGWFFTAPRLPFGFAHLWGLAALGAAVLFWRLLPGRMTRGAMAVAVAIGLLPVAGRLLHSLLYDQRPLPSVIVDALLIRRGDDNGFHPPDPAEEEVRPFVTSSGLRLLVPLETNRCYDAALPCTPHPAPNLRLRGDGLAEGFRVTGSWQAERWPNPGSRFLEVWRDYEDDMAGGPRGASAR
jgi:hypothetical protein